ncbi:MAG: Crp/Fnr family transcriptional regulator [Clostridia bacterium]|nr:Crp/Fnr family transcriptional regulator [Clostridia bacterium]
MSDTKYDILAARLPFWERLREARKNDIYAHTRVARYKKGSIIADVGEDCGVIIVKRGRICAYTVSEEGREVALLCCYSGDICLLAAHNLIDTSSFNICVSAETEADVLIIDARIFADVCDNCAPAEAFVRRLISSHFCHVVGDMQSMLLHSPERRIAAYLCATAERTGSAKVKTTHELIAKHVGTAREVVTRTLKKMSDDGILSAERGMIIIKDKSQLKNLM